MKKFLPGIASGFLLLVFFLFPKPILADIENAVSDPDINIRLRRWIPTSSLGSSPNIDSTRGIIYKYHFGSDAEIDGRAPQLDTTLGRSPNMTTLYQMNEYEGSPVIPPDGVSNWGSTLIGVTSSGAPVRVPQSGYDIGGGYQATILYATRDDVTLSYTLGEAGITIGYVIHFLDFDVADEILNLYNAGKRQGKIIALPCGYNLGTARGSELLVSIRDTGTFMDPRSGYDWWQVTVPRTTSPLPCQDLEPRLVTPGESPGPATLPQVSPGPKPRPYVPCSEERPDLAHPFQREFHSLRPYQASPCNEAASQTMLMCGNDLIARKGIVVDGHASLPIGQTTFPNGDKRTCRATSDGGRACDFEITDTFTFSVSLADAELPILGNTQLVANSYNLVNQVDEKTRINEYVSWYLNGTVFRAENHSPNIEDIINLSGPIRKLLSGISQDNLKNEQAGEAGSTRHNQVIAGGLAGPTAGWGLLSIPRIGAVRIRDFLNAKDYSPLSSTEDRVGEIEVPGGGSMPLRDIATQLGAEEGNEVGISYVSFIPSVRGDKAGKDDLYFAHVQEAQELSNALQSTFAPGGEQTFSGDYGSALHPADSRARLAEALAGKHCEVIETRSNPGDDLFGDQNNFGYSQLAGTIQYGATFNCEFHPAAPVDDFDECVEYCYTQEPDDSAGCINRRCYRQAETSCEKDALVAVPIYTRTPGVKEIWERLVDGNFGVFKRFFPQGLVEIEETPAVGKASYVSGEAEVFAGGTSKSGAQANIYFPYLGGVYDYFLKGIQCALRPQGFCESGAIEEIAAAPPGETPVTVPEGCFAPQPGSPELLSMIDAAVENGKRGAARGVPKKLLEAIYWIEGWLYYISPSHYDCQPNPWTALGLMQVTNPAYRWIAPPSQRVEGQEAGNCNEIPDKVNRCYAVDEMDIAAGVLLVKVGKWDFVNYRPSGRMDLVDKNEIYTAAWRYYGIPEPDILTQDFASNINNIPVSDYPKLRGGSPENMGYGDLVWYYVYCKGQPASSCPAYPAR